MLSLICIVSLQVNAKQWVIFIFFLNCPYCLLCNKQKELFKSIEIIILKFIPKKAFISTVILSQKGIKKDFVRDKIKNKNEIHGVALKNFLEIFYFLILFSLTHLSGHC